MLSKTRLLLVETLEWLHDLWRTNRWKYGRVDSEESAPAVFTEIAVAACQYAPALVASVLAVFDTYLDDVDQPSAAYLSRLAAVGPCSASARLAYSYFLARDIDERFARRHSVLRDYALRHIAAGYNGADAAMLLDMILETQPLVRS